MNYYIIFKREFQICIIKNRFCGTVLYIFLVKLTIILNRIGNLGVGDGAVACWWWMVEIDSSGHGLWPFGLRQTSGLLILLIRKHWMGGSDQATIFADFRVQIQMKWWVWWQRRLSIYFVSVLKSDIFFFQCETSTAFNRFQIGIVSRRSI